jgi:hypothetical protein
MYDKIIGTDEKKNGALEGKFCGLLSDKAPFTSYLELQQFICLINLNIVDPLIVDFGQRCCQTDIDTCGKNNKQWQCR